MDLVLYDTEHFETLHTWIRLLEGEDRRLHLLVPAAVRTQLEALGVHEHEKLRWHPLPQANKDHAGTVERLVKKLDAAFLLLGTVAFRHYAFARVAKKLRGCKVLLQVHDVEDSFRPLRGSGFRGLLQQWGKRQLAASVSAFAVLLPAMKQLILQKRYTLKPVYVVPGRLFDEHAYKPPPAGPLRLVVPGSIDPARRDYTSVLRLLQRTKMAGEPELQIIIAGSSLKGYNPFAPGDDRQTLISGDHVPAADYARALQDAAIVWAPLPLRFSTPGKPDEAYGSSKSSGTFFDAVSAGRPLLVPAHIRVPEQLASCTLSYADEDELYYLLLALAANGGAQTSLQLLALAAARHFTVENVRIKLLPQLLSAR